MKSLRLALITRRFWPLVGGAEKVIANLANQFRCDGNQVQLVTARWERHWPTELSYRDVHLTRLPHPATRGWGTLRYMRFLERWLKQHQDSLDAVLVSMLKHDAYAAIHALRKTGVPVIVRAEGAGSLGDCSFHEQARFGMRIRAQCEQADAIIACSQSIMSELHQAGFEDQLLHYVANGVEVLPKWTRQRQGNARAALADAHPILHVEPQTPLAVFTGRLHEHKGLMDLVNAWPKIIERYPAGKLWLIGEGPDGPRLWDRIRQLGLTEHIILPGAFDEISEVLQAADLFIFPSYEEGMSLSLLEAMSAAVPVVATDIPGNRQLIDQGTHGRLFPARNVAALADSILHTLNDIAAAQTMALAARERVVAQFSIQQMADQHLQIIRQAIQHRQTNR
jgi:glycosyltransferase involved in cell wall biosynthesis